MKKLIVSLFTVALLVSGNSYAKGFAKEGSITLGSGLSFSMENDKDKDGEKTGSTTAWSLSPGGQYFVADNIALGLNLVFGSEEKCSDKDCNDSNTTDSMGLKLTPGYYHELNDDMYLMVKGSFGFLSGKVTSKTGGTESPNPPEVSGMTFGGAVGVAMPFATKGAERGGVLEIGLGYDVTNLTTKVAGQEVESGEDELGLTTSFAVFF